MPTNALSAVVLASCAHASLADARRLIDDASKAARLTLHRHKVPRLLADARHIIASARKAYAHAMAALARRGQLSHHYAETGHAVTFAATGYGRYRALVRVAHGLALWTSPRTYGKRQSAQRAALAHVRKLATAAACREVMA